MEQDNCLRLPGKQKTLSRRKPTMANMRKESSCIGCVEDSKRLDRFFELVAERINAGQAATNGDRIPTETRSVQCAGRN
jgi:hypothetical protein